MFLKHLIVIVFVSLISAQGRTQNFQNTENCQNAYKAFMAMKVGQGRNLLALELKQNPKNILPLVLVNYEDFISLCFNENPAEYKKRKVLKSNRLDILEHADKNSPYYLFSKALIYFQWSMIQIKYTDYWDAAWDFRKSFLLFKENKVKFPNFACNNIYIGSQEALISTIPKGYKWISTILGLKGDMTHGMLLLKSYANSREVPFKEESYLYYIYLKNYIENDVEGASQLIKMYNLDTKNNQLFVFMAANLALNNKKAQVTETVINNRNKGPEYLPFPMLEYELGDAKMRRLDFSAIQNYLQFIATSKSNFYIKDAYQSIAYCYYLQNNLLMANQYKEKIKTVGKLESDADKQAQKFATSGQFPHVDFLKARLLNDGGYNDMALKLLLQKDISAYKTNPEKLEYTYRLGRIYDDLKQEDKALLYYNQTIALGKNVTEYYAARAAIQAGSIYEKRGNKAEAKRYFQLELDLGDHEFKNSLDQRAKSGLNRLNGN